MQPKVTSLSLQKIPLSQFIYSSPFKRTDIFTESVPATNSILGIVMYFRCANLGFPSLSSNEFFQSHLKCVNMKFVHMHPHKHLISKMMQTAICNLTKVSWLKASINWQSFQLLPLSFPFLPLPLNIVRNIFIPFQVFFTQLLNQQLSLKKERSGKPQRIAN